MVHNMSRDSILAPISTRESPTKRATDDENHDTEHNMDDNDEGGGSFTLELGHGIDMGKAHLQGEH